MSATNSNTPTTRKSGKGEPPVSRAYAHLRLSRWPFPVVPDPPFCTFLAAREQLQRDVESLSMRSMAAEFDLLRPGTQAMREGRKSLISRQHEF